MLLNPDREKKRFCDQIIIPAIEPRSKYKLNLSSLREKNEYSPQRWRYKCIGELDKIGDWNVDLKIDSIRKNELKSEGYYPKLFYDKRERTDRFKVYSKNTYAQIEISAKIIWITIAASIFSVIIGAILGSGLTRCSPSII